MGGQLTVRARRRRAEQTQVARSIGGSGASRECHYSVVVNGTAGHLDCMRSGGCSQVHQVAVFRGWPKRCSRSLQHEELTTHSPGPMALLGVSLRVVLLVALLVCRFG
jgi:hypothetical protein